MLTITVPKTEFYDEKNNLFINVEETVLQLEHSLISLSKWECKWNKALLSRLKGDKSIEETIDYIKAMTINKVNPDVYLALTRKNINDIYEYINLPMTAVYFPDEKEKITGMRDTPTAEVIYYWMISLNIPFECQKWHLNRLMALIRVCDIKNEAASKRVSGKGRKNTRPNRSSYQNRRALNESRLKQYNTSG